MFYLLERRWLELGCIVFSQYYDTARWVGERLIRRLPRETIAAYAGAGWSGLLSTASGRASAATTSRRRIASGRSGWSSPTIPRAKALWAGGLFREEVTALLAYESKKVAAADTRAQGTRYITRRLHIGASSLR